jgi:hypothetical protein
VLPGKKETGWHDYWQEYENLDTSEEQQIKELTHPLLLGTVDVKYN